MCTLRHRQARNIALLKKLIDFFDPYCFYKHSAPDGANGGNMKALNLLLTLLVISLCSAVVTAQTANPTDPDDESSRQIVLDRFNTARPLSEAAKAGMSSGNTSMKPPVYRRTGTARIGRRGARPPATEEIGVTVWRLRPSRESDQGGRVLVHDGLKQTQYTPERIEAGTPLNVGDRVRITVESPRPGFLYIVDREQYADGSFGEPMLIFPTLKTRG